MDMNEHIERAQGLRGQFSEDLPSAAKELKALFSDSSIPSKLRTEAVMIYLETNDLMELDKLGKAPNWTADAQQLIGRGEKAVEEWLNMVPMQQQAQIPELVQQQQVREFFQEKATTKTPVFVGKGMVKTYPNFENPFTLGPLDLELNFGEITGVVGENGNGKSTLLKMVAGMIKIDAGEISYPSLCTADLDWHQVKSKIGYIPQRLDKWSRSVRENLRFYAAIHGIRGEEADNEMEFILRRMNLHHHMNAKWESLSGGYQMRFEIARTLIAKPRLLILDEPLANLDVAAQTILLRDLRFLVNSLRYPLSVLLSSQHLHKVENVSDRVIFLREGKAIFNGLTAEIGHDRKENFFEIAGDFDAAKLRKTLQGMPVYQVRDDGQTYLIRSSLELEGDEILKILIENQMKVQFFRDISQSTRQFFEVTA